MSRGKLKHQVRGQFLSHDNFILSHDITFMSHRWCYKTNYSIPSGWLYSIVPVQHTMFKIWYRIWSWRHTSISHTLSPSIMCVQYIGGCSVHQGETMSTLGEISWVHRGGNHVALEEQVGKNLSISVENPNVLNIPWCNEHSPMYSWYPLMDSWYPLM